MDFQKIISQLSNQQNNPISLSNELYEDISPVPESNRGKEGTIKLNNISFPIIDPTEMLIRKLVVSNQQYHREPYHRVYKNMELDPIPVESVEENLKKYRKKWALILGFFSFIIPGSGQALCNRLKPAFVFLLLSALCIASSYLLTYQVLVGYLIIGMVSGIDEYRAVKKFNYLPYCKKLWFFSILFLIIYAIGIYLVLKRTW